MTERLHHRRWQEEKIGTFLKNDKRGAIVQLKARDGGVIIVPEKKVEFPPNTPVVIAFEVYQKIQDRVALVWSEEAFLGLD